MKEISKYQRLRKKSIENSDPEPARQTESHMRNKFKFYGLKTLERRKSYHDLIKLEKANKKIDWKFLDQAWADEHREVQYFVCDYLVALGEYFESEDIDHIFNYVRPKQWWNTIGSLIKPIGNIGLRDNRVADLVSAWSKGDDFWVRRVAVEHQLLHKDKMNVKLLNAILENNLGSSEFFISKAIGRALRDYSKANPDWIKNLIGRRHSGLATLSIGGGSKYLS